MSGRSEGSVLASARPLPGRSRLDFIEAWDMTVASEVGQRVHLVIGRLASSNPTPGEVIDAVAELWRERPVGGSTSASARLRCATAVSVYVQRCRPASPWALDGVEVALPDAVADLVWVHPETRMVVIDEVKSTTADLADPRIADQLDRLVRSGRSKWRGRFGGVRLVPLGSPGRIQVFDRLGTEVVVVPTPEGMEVR